MAVFIIMIIVTIGVAMGIGAQIHYEASKEYIKADWNGVIGCSAMLALLIFCIILVLVSPSGLAEHYINKYRNGKIVEQVNYHYINLPDGTRELKDSTTFYVRKK